MGTPLLRCLDLAQLKPTPAPALADWNASSNWLKKVVERAQHDSQNLFAYFRLERKDDLTVQIMSAKDGLLARMFSDFRRQSNATVPGASGSRGGADEAGVISQQDAALQTSYVYYSVLYYILHKLFPKRQEVQARFTRLSVAPEDVPRVSNLLKIPVFHTSLLAVAAMLVQEITSRDSRCLKSNPWEFLGTVRNAGLQHNMLAVWNACRWFEEAFTSDLVQKDDPTVTAVDVAPDVLRMPSMPGRYVLGRTLRLCEEREVLTQGSTFYAIYAQLGGLHEGIWDKGFTEGDLKLVLSFVEACTRRTISLGGLMASRLVNKVKEQDKVLRWQTFGGAFPSAADIGPTAAQQPRVPLKQFPRLVEELVHRMMTSCLYLAFNQHVAVLLACCIYGMAKALRIQLSFSDTTGLLVDELPDISLDDFEKVELVPAMAADDAPDQSLPVGCSIAIGATLGGIRPFYNSIFLPRMQGDVRHIVNFYTSATATVKPEASQVSNAAALGIGFPFIASEQLVEVKVEGTAMQTPVDDSLTVCPHEKMEQPQVPQPQRPQPEVHICKAPKHSNGSTAAVVDNRRPLASLHHSMGSRKIQILEDYGDAGDRAEAMQPPGFCRDNLFQSNEAIREKKRLSSSKVLQDRKIITNHAALPLAIEGLTLGNGSCKSQPLDLEPSNGLMPQAPVIQQDADMASKENIKGAAATRWAYR